MFTLPFLTVTTCVGSSSSKNRLSCDITTTDPSNFRRAAVKTCPCIVCSIVKRRRWITVMTDLEGRIVVQ
jgi:hypothetical protein